MPMYFKQVACLECGHEMPADILLTACTKCGSNWLDARYDYEAVANLWPAALASRDRSLWRYAELLPQPEPDPEISMGEGFT
ncbi:MAG: threonine synthase, partial [Anaerolineae bacterium]|nr:threonine synthase [Anaerolineae bacterium]